MYKNKKHQLFLTRNLKKFQVFFLLPKKYIILGKTHIKSHATFFLKPETDFDNVFFSSQFLGYNSRILEKKVFFCLVVRGGYPLYTLSGPTTNIFLCVFPKPKEKKVVAPNIYRKCCIVIFFRLSFLWFI